MKIFKHVMAAVLITIMPLVCAAESADNDVLFQVSTIDALLEGVYDGDVTFQELAEKGNFGLGTLNSLDGEMVALDGEFFQVKSDGKVYKVSPDAKTPFAVVTVFEKEKAENVGNLATYAEVKEYLDTRFPSQNIFYAIRVDGDFEYVKVRSVPRQERPYVPLAEVIKDQTVFEYTNIRGTILGFWCPQYAKGVNVSGYHMHFISSDRTRGGHLLEVKLREGIAFLDDTANFSMHLPLNNDFLDADLTGIEAGTLHKVEGK